MNEAVDADADADADEAVDADADEAVDADVVANRDQNVPLVEVEEHILLVMGQNMGYHKYLLY